jgi:Polyketide cyclase / dehydrase and lipid transport.
MYSTANVSEELEEGLRYVVCKLLVNASPEKVWGILTDYQRVTQRFKNMSRLKVLEDKGDIKVMEQQVQPLKPVPPITYSVEVKENYPVSLEWRNLTNYIKINQGRFFLESVDDGAGTIVTFAACAQAVVLVPTVIVRYQMKVIMPKVLNTLKELAEKLDV